MEDGNFRSVEEAIDPDGIEGFGHE